MQEELGQSLRFRFEAFSKFASELGEARQLDEIFESLRTNVKFIIEAFCFQIVYKGPVNQVCFELFLGSSSINEDESSPCFGLADKLLKQMRPQTYPQQVLMNSEIFEGSIFQHERVRNALSFSLELGAGEKALIVAGNKNDNPYQQLDFKFCRLILRILAAKLEQFFVSRDLVRSLERQEKLLSDLHFAKSYSENILRSMGDGLIITDEKGIIIDLNPAILDQLGYQRKQLLQGPAGLLFGNGDPEKLPWTPEEWKILKGKGSIRGREKSLRQVTGKHIPVFFSGGAIYDKKKKISGVVCVLHDISERKQMESDRQRLELAQAVAVAEKKRAEELKKLNEELDRFVYSSSHDLRAPLSSVLGLIALTRSAANNPTEQDTYLEMMEKSVRRLDTFINNITDYSRNSRTEINAEEIDFQSFVQEVYNSLIHINQGPLIDFQVEKTGEAAVFSDTNRLNIILSNFLSNALKYHNLEQENPYIQVHLACKPNQLDFAVIDNGKGIANEHHDKLFDMFYRASRTSQGSGIGLYIVKETIEKLGGSLYFESVVGKGSSFYFSIPNLTPNPETPSEIPS